MKWNHNVAKDEDTRIVKRFAILPILAHDKIAWLETVYIVQEYSTNYADDGWHNDRFSTKEDYLTYKGFKI